MKQKINFKLLLASSIFFALASCNSQQGTKDQSESTDTTAQTTSDSVSAHTSAQSNAMDAVKIAPGLYKPLTDSLGIRVLEINYKPGDSSAMHSHPDLVLYVING